MIAQGIDDSAAAIVAFPTTACSRDEEKEVQSKMHEVGRCGVRGYGGEPRAGMRARLGL